MKKKYLTLILQGGLGNQMFQYATSYVLALKNSLGIKINISSYKNSSCRKFELYKFPNIKKNIIFENNFFVRFFFLVLNKIPMIFKFYGRNKFENSPFVFNRNLFKTNFSKGVSLIGYFQSEKYFIDKKEKIFNLFNFPFNKNNSVRLYLKKIKKYNSVAIHFRGGDYITNLKAKNFHGNLSLNYYLKSVKYINNQISNPHFFVFSEDAKFIEDMVIIKNFKYTFVDIKSAFNSLYLMSMCKHHIIANSSFSWWGAWLSKNDNKIICAPKNWVKVNIKTDDVVPKSWKLF
jgi:hypothetical protein